MKKLSRYEYSIFAHSGTCHSYGENEMSKYTGPFREHKFDNPTNGAYIQVYQRPNERVQLDLNFFEGTKSIIDTLQLQKILALANALARKWDSE